jgi:hypothetical protein
MFDVQRSLVSFSIKLAVFLARGGAHMRLRRFGTLKRFNVEHRTPNIEHSILMTLRLIYFKTSEPQIFEGRICFAQSFYKMAEYSIRCWTFNVRCSTFISFFRSNWSLLCPVTWLTPETLNPEPCVWGRSPKPVNAEP